MEQKPEQIHSDEARCDGLRRVLVGQYMFHEAGHHPLQSPRTTEVVATIPKAHTIADIYKCLHQGEFSVGHSIDDPDRFSHALASELSKAEPSSTEPVLENVSVDDSVFRVNLRPYRKIFADREKEACDLLVEACLNSATVHKGTLKNFIASLNCFKHLNEKGELIVHGKSYIFPSKLVNLFLVQVNDFIQASRNVPVLSHSPIYRSYNAPSYRVVDRATLERCPLAFLFQELQ